MSPRPQSWLPGTSLVLGPAKPDPSAGHDREYYRTFARAFAGPEIDPVGDRSGLRGAPAGASGGSGDAPASGCTGALAAAWLGVAAFDEGPCGFAGAAAGGGAALSGAAGEIADASG
jgi:hypothetical protein